MGINPGPNRYQICFEASEKANCLGKERLNFGKAQHLFRGIFRHSAAPASVAAIAAETGISLDRSQDICRALDAYGIFIKANNCYSLDEQWASLVTSDLIRTFQVTVSDAFAKAKAFSQPGASYWQLSSEERLALAKGVTFNPSSANTSDFY